MVKNTQGGNRAKSKAHKDFVPKTKNMNELFKIDGQEYGYVVESYSNKNSKIMCFDKKQRDGVMRGKIEGRVKLKKGDIVLVSLRGYQDSKCDILTKYDLEDINFLLNNNAFTRSFVQNGGGVTETTGVVFGETKKVELADILPEGEIGDSTGDLLDDMDLIPVKKVEPKAIEKPKEKPVEIIEENGSMLLNIDDI